MDQISILCAAALMASYAVLKSSTLPRRIYRLVLYCALVTGGAIGVATICPG